MHLSGMHNAIRRQILPRAVAAKAHSVAPPLCRLDWDLLVMVVALQDRSKHQRLELLAVLPAALWLGPVLTFDSSRLPSR